ncbi:TDP-N-acetylfucosamine:lipid II N-acetylfucosaminyltransferase family protein [Halomonas koreensis]|uniref:TDP-N-acetylfucosamine:lipid II N-acetylfucosaminyltransferase n=1 Tax=Halomonas koreensis TaxID=245385 RepID=A0ABU1FZ40_9GAMM|nr:TDP-N-acetylfucosamine:lipid II N-acetylfucosaminyltransferase [Halomonas koreensis]MDR5865949.1 TDP-N-acetylfucosamine:lipid II N-acetylfucosaminyltransferase [Halomonas koreensis]
MSNKVLHVCTPDKFIPPFIDFVEDNFDLNDHVFWLKEGGRFPVEEVARVNSSGRGKIKKIKGLVDLAKMMSASDKIILHGLFDIRVILLLWSMPWQLKKAYWVLWGGDLYSFRQGDKTFKWRIREFFKAPVIRGMGFIITTVPGDVDLARKWYGFSGKFHQSLMYRSHLARELTSNGAKKENSLDVVKVQIGNSADPSNEQFELIDKLSKLRGKSFLAYCPLSYGDQLHKSKVIDYGVDRLGESFVPLTEFMGFEDYNAYMEKIDVALFNHRRQQAMGNIIALLSMGKTVYLRSDQTPYEFFRSLGVNVKSVENMDSLSLIDEESSMLNMKIINENFNMKLLKASWEKVFDE